MVPHLGLGKVGGDAVDTNAFCDGVARIPQALPLCFLPGVEDPALDLVEKAGPWGVYKHHLQGREASVSCRAT